MIRTKGARLTVVLAVTTQLLSGRTAEVRQNSELPTPIRVVCPEYPELAVRTNQAGVVRVGFKLSKDGAPTDITIFSPSKLLEPSVLQAFSQWRWEGQESQGEIVFTVVFEFRLKDKAKHPDKMNTATFLPPDRVILEKYLILVHID